MSTEHDGGKAQGGMMDDKQIDAVFSAMPGGAAGFLKDWGYRHFARALLKATSHDTEVERLRVALAAATRGTLPQTMGEMGVSACGCWHSRVYGGKSYAHKCEAHILLEDHP